MPGGDGDHVSNVDGSLCNGEVTVIFGAIHLFTTRAATNFSGW